MSVHTDIIVAATNQWSWDGKVGGVATARLATGDNNYCDKIRHDVATGAAAADIPYTFITSGGASASGYGLVGTNKCTYIYSLDKHMGAPAFKIIKADFMDFQFHFLEYFED